MLETFVDPPTIQSYTGYYQTLLSISGVLLGLAFTTLVFILQSGFSSFRYSRRMFLRIYSLLGRHLLIALAYITIVPLGLIYFSPYKTFLSIIYYIFSFFFIKSFLDYHRHRGYIHTIFSSKSNRYSGGLLEYFQYIRNLGCSSIIVLLLYLAIFIAYPVAISFHESGRFTLTDKGFFYSTLLLLVYAILRIIIFIPEFFEFTSKEIEYKPLTTNEESEDSTDYVQDKRVLRDYLLGHGLSELGLKDDDKATFLDGTVSVNFLPEQSTPEAWFNIEVKVKNPTVVEIRDAVLDYAFKMLQLLHKSMVDINSFVLSFHITIRGERKSRSMFFRTNRAELDKILLNPKDPRAAVMQIENKLFDELLRDLPLK